MGKPSRDKGKRGEREAAKELARLFGAECRRGQQYCGAAGNADVIGLPGVHLEVKRTEKLSLWPAITQAICDASVGDVPMVLHRPNDRPWLAIVRLDDLPQLVKNLAGGA